MVLQQIADDPAANNKAKYNPGTNHDNDWDIKARDSGNNR